MRYGDAKKTNDVIETWTSLAGGIEWKVRTAAPTRFKLTVNYSTADGTAVAGTDYTSTSGTLTFAAGVTKATFNVPMLNKKENSNLTFTATLSGPVNATLGSGQTDTATIVNTPLTSAVVDLNADIALPSNGTPINTFSNWGMKLAAEISGAAVSSYSWSLSQPSYAGTLYQSTGYNPTFTWSSFTGASNRGTPGTCCRRENDPAGETDEEGDDRPRSPPRTQLRAQTGHDGGHTPVSPD